MQRSRFPLAQQFFAVLLLLGTSACTQVPDEGAQRCRDAVLEGDVTNARDLGGWPLRGGGRVACGRLYRGGDLHALGDLGCGAFAALGITTVVDLRESTTQAEKPAVSCVAEQASVVSAPLPKLLPDTPENYLALFDEGAAVAQLFSALAAPDGTPAYFHCVIGRDRASFAAALVLLALGAERGTVVEEFEASTAAGVEVRVECIEAVLDEVELRGGIEATLRAMGVAAADIEDLRAAAGDG